jgi:DeoR family ulaG and ulaABCDEF operon transcriptional repressor
MTVPDLASELSISAVTVRRDLAGLAKEGKLRRVRGGAESCSKQWEQSLSVFGVPPFSGRIDINLQKKRQIAKKAVELCGDDECIIIDGGTTTYAMSGFLTDHHLQILTNSFAVAKTLMATSNQIVLGGGLLYPQAEMILDPFENDHFKNYSATKLFMGASGVDSSGITNSNALILQSEKNMIRQSEQVIILVDSSKFKQKGSLFLTDLPGIDILITDSGIPKEAKKYLKAAEVEVVIA